MSKTASILACCVVSLILPVAARALPVSPVPIQIAGSKVILIGERCGRGFHRDPDGDCAPNGRLYDSGEIKFFGLPYANPPDVGLPYLPPPNGGLPYVALPDVKLPYIGPPNGGLPYVALPDVGLPYVGPPNGGLPYVPPPDVGLPYVGPPEYVAPRSCPYGYAYSAHRCVPS